MALVDMSCKKQIITQIRYSSSIKKHLQKLLITMIKYYW